MASTQSSRAGRPTLDYTIQYAPGAVAITSNAGNVAFVSSLHGSILLRSPESTGLDYWLTRMAGGQSSSSVAIEIYNSSEAVAIRAHQKTPKISESAAFKKAIVAQAQAQVS